MKKRNIPFSMPFIDHRETAEVVKVLEGKWITSGPEVKKLETHFKKYLDVKTAVALSSCTAALNIALAVHGIGENHDVITTPYTFASTALSIVHCGAFPVLVDVEAETFNIDAKQIEKIIACDYRLTDKGLESKQTKRLLKAIIPVHFGGQPADMETIDAIARKYNLVVIEDAAHAPGAMHKNVKTGKSNNLVCFSFYSNKNLTTGEGGMITTDNAALEKKIR
ncbi:MAG: DegT/DnrJ/EryC1/StrS aminotransferase family protein, partial [bacterium]|nr:DegT/DnrJ/EryC1/StrS aminotransferase family protein [bacterium]